MFYLLVTVAVALFLAHVVLLLLSFKRQHLVSSRYFYSHFTLWLTGVVVFAMAIIYHGSHQSGFLDFFDTPFKLAMILVFTFALSLVAHSIVRFFVLPLLQKNR